ncbi:hypothetical protein CF319_g406 [Tilletia indica]|nr:hypothetical protein CF319_g406 [Tilletia indica]
MPKVDKKKSRVPAENSKGKQKDISSAQPLRIAGFTLLPLRYSSTSTYKHGTVHYLFIRPHHSSSNKTTAPLPSDRTLFVANLPVDASDRHLRTLFKTAGAIERTVFQQGSTVPLSGQHILDALQAGEDQDGDEEEEEEEDIDMNPAQAQGEETALLQAKIEQNTRKRNRRKRSDRTEQESAPTVHPLPALDARELAGARALLPTSTSAHIVFLDASSLQRALTQAEQTSTAFITAGGPSLLSSSSPKTSEIVALLKTARPWLDPFVNPIQGTTPPPPPPQLGLPTFLASYASHRPPLESIKAFSDSRIALHLFLRANPDRDPTEQARAARRGIQPVRVGAEGELLDQDGFTIVTAGGKYGRAAESGSKVGGVEGASVRVARNRPYMATGSAYEAALGPPKKKSKSKDLEDFYRFQTREKNREKLAQLRAKFQDDKLKVAKLKESRKFKPY